jgi:toxin-antitoxin system PIN domain toxin
VLVYAHREESSHHGVCRQWLRQAFDADEPFGIADVVLSGFVRVVTNKAIFKAPTPLGLALEVVEIVRTHPQAVAVAPGPRHWHIFTRLCRDAAATGALVADAYLAALAIESGCEWVTTDGDFARFPGLKWRRPGPARPR